jgi:hypothetical protein
VYRVVVIILLLLVGSINFLSDACALGPSPVPQTGQSTCYNTAGTIITPCKDTGQDGDKLRGVSWPNPRFSVNLKNDGVTPNGTVTDNLTALIWLQNANCFGTQVWATALESVRNLASGQCFNPTLLDGSTVGQWRLPNRHELESLVNEGQVSTNIWLLNQGFYGVTNANYWSSSSYFKTTPASNAWVVHMGTGDASSSAKGITTIYVWAVRGGQ